MAVNLSHYMPEPFEMQVAPDLTITSPVPSVAAGKLIASYQAVSAEQSRRASAGEPLLSGDEAIVPGWPDTTEQLARIVLGDAEWERLISINAPEMFIVQASTCAVIYWANGGSEAAVRMYLDATFGESDETPAPKGNRAQRRSKNGRPTA